MKTLAAIASLLFFVSFNVHAIPPPPPLPAPIGYLNGKLSVRVNASLACGEMICPNESETCDFDVKIPVIAATNIDEVYMSYLLRDSTNNKDVICKKVFEGYLHEMRMSAYVTLNSSGDIKVITSVGSGKSAVVGSNGSDLALSNHSQNVTLLSQTSPSLKIRNTIGEQIYSASGKSGTPTGIDRTRTTIMTTFEFPTLQLESVKKP